MNLMLHCGGYAVDRDDVTAVETPHRTKSWVPVSHDRLIDLVENALTEGGHEITQSVHALSHKGKRYFGLMEIGTDGTIAGLRNSHDKTFPSGLVLGQGIFVCDNLAFSGEVKFGRRHTRYIERDLPGLVHASVGRLMNMRIEAQERQHRYEQTGINDVEAHHLIVKAVDARVMANSRIPKVLAEWREPSYDDFRTRDLWALYNAFTHVLKDSNIFHKPQATMALQGLMDTWALN